MNYIIWANIYLVFFYGFYWFFMRSETFFQLNRWYLLGSSLLAFILPVLDLKKYFWAPKGELFSAALNFEGQAYALGGSAEQSSATGLAAFWALPLFVWVYFLGCLFFFGKLLHQGVLLRKSLKSANVGQAYSFFHIIHVDPEVKNYAKVLAHEKVHAEQFHSADILLMELLRIFNWFNPVVYLLCRSTKLNHEYIADARTAEYGSSRIQYAESLLSQAFETSNFSLKNNFINESFIKSRIAMLFKNKSKKSVLSRFLILIPIMLVIISFQGEDPEIMAVTSANLTEPTHPLTESSGESFLASQKEERAVPKEGWTGFLQGVTNRYRYSKGAKAAKVKGKIVAIFVVEKDGSLTDIRIVKDLGYGTGEEIVRVLKSSPNWIPATMDGKAVRSSFTLPILLDYDKKAEVGVISNGDVTPPIPAMAPDGGTNGEGHLFTAVEVQPVPPGGMQTFLQYIGTDYVYPKEAEAAEVSGRVITTFVVEKDGTLSNVRIVRDLGHGTGEEAVRVIQNSGKWKPGIQNGQSVRVQFTMPIVLNMTQGEASPF